jgi:hypothetical protein
MVDKKEYPRAWALAEVAPYLPEDRLVLASDVARASRDAGLKALALAGLAPYMGAEASRKTLREALAVVRSIDDATVRGNVLAEVSPYLPESLLNVALNDASDIMPPFRRLWVMERLVARLTELGHPQEALRIVSSIEFDQGRILGKLAPGLPEPLLGAALTTALAIEKEWDRMEALEGLAPRLADVGRTEEAFQAASAIEIPENRDAALADLTRRLAEKGHPQEALRAAMLIQGWGLRDKVLQKLATLLAGLGHPEEALQAATNIPYTLFRLTTLSEIAPRLPAKMGLEALRQALQTAQAVEEAGHRDLALAELAPCLAKMGRIGEALRTVRAIEDTWRRAEALWKLAPHLSGPLLGEAVRMALAIENGAVVAPLAFRLAETGYPLEALEAARAIRSPTQRFEVLVELALRLAKRNYPQEALRAVGAIEQNRNRAKGLAKVVPHLPTELLDDAIQAARQLKEDLDGFEEVAEVLYILAVAGRADEALEAALAIRDSAWRAHALRRLAPGLPEPLLGAALTTALALENEGDRMEALEGLAPRLADVGRTEEAFQAASAIEFSGNRNAALADLARRLAEQGHPQEALRAARAIDDPFRCSKALVELGGWAQAPVLAEAFHVAMAIKDKAGQDLALKGLAPRLAELGEAQLALDAARAIHERMARALLLADIAPLLAKRRQYREALEAVHEIEELKFEPELLKVSASNSAEGNALESLAVEVENSLPSGEQQDLTSPAAPPVSRAERHISVWISERMDNPFMPLRLGDQYTLNLKIGEAVLASLLKDMDTKVPPSEVPREGLKTCWVITSSTMELAALTDRTTATVSDATGSIRVWSAQFPLELPYEGDSEISQLKVTPRVANGAGFEVLIYVRQEIYRQFSVKLAVRKPTASTTWDRKKVTTVETDLVHTPAEQLDLEPTPRWARPPGEFTIAVVGQGVAYARGDVGTAFVNEIVPWYGVHTMVAGPIENVRNAAERFRGECDSYLNNINPDDLVARLRKSMGGSDWAMVGTCPDPSYQQEWAKVSTSPWLRDLAVLGYRLYGAFFPSGSLLRGWLDSLAPGCRINISWLPTSGPGWLAHIPWGLMYMLEPPPLGTPIDPAGFAAFRFRLNYLPYSVQGGSKALGRLGDTYQAYLLYQGSRPEDPTGMEAQWQRKQQEVRKRAVFIPRTPADENLKQQLLALLEDPKPTPMIVLYLFCQCNSGEGKDPVLQFGATTKPMDLLRQTELGTKYFADQPLVFANACSTAASDPYIANELERSFFSRGCRAYIGTESKVPIPFASRFASTFFRFFYGDGLSEPMAAGEAMVQARLFLWAQYRNIGGLFYSYVSQYELFLASEVEVQALRKTPH